MMISVADATPSVREESVSHSPPSDLRSWKPPATVTAKMLSSCGELPSRIEKRGSRRMPHATHTGQSGPPTRMHSLPADQPGSARMCRIARIVSVLYPTNERTATESPIRSPITTCCTADVSILSVKEMAVESRMPGQNEVKRGMRNEPSRYTAGPGTGGHMKRAKPAAKKAAHTTPSPRRARSSVWMSHELSTLSSLPKPTFITITTTPNHTTLLSTELHSHARTNSAIARPGGVSTSRRRTRMPERGSIQSSAPRGSQMSTRTRCFTAERSRKAQKGAQPPKTSSAFARSPKCASSATGRPAGGRARTATLCSPTLDAARRSSGSATSVRCSSSQPTDEPTRTATTTTSASASISTDCASAESAPETAACTYMARPAAPNARHDARANAGIVPRCSGDAQRASR
mmetsp:Transcript_20053/g.62372  ORF Transcript_20053/g.62372 Transcript_20053/m.62372 type:complete len:406 (-) Transcript_20053:553-1770(-)